MSTEAAQRIEEGIVTPADTDAELQRFRETRLRKLDKYLAADEDQLSGESYPRLKHKTEVMTVADFLEEYKNYDPSNVDPKEVTLHGKRQLRAFSS
jgi:hypothetical protein